MIREYEVNFNNAAVSQFLTQGQTVTRKSNGVEETDGTYRNRPIPGTDTTVAVRKDFNTNKPLININQKDLDIVVPYFGFINQEKKEPINEASVNFGLSEFWNHEDLVLDIKNNGIKMTVSTDPTDTPKEFFWFKVMEADPLFFIDDGKHRRPENMAEVMFIVKPSNTGNKTIKKEYTSLADASTTLRAILAASVVKKRYILDQIGEGLYNQDTKEKDLEDTLLQQLDKHSDKRLDNGLKLGDYVDSVINENEDSFSISQSVNQAHKLGLIKRAGDMYYFESIVCGGSYKEVEEYFKKSTNKKDLTALEIVLSKNKK